MTEWETFFIEKTKLRHVSWIRMRKKRKEIREVLSGKKKG